MSADADKIMDEVIRRTGSGKALSEAVGVRQSAVSNWRRSGIPAARVAAVSRATGLPLAFLRPDLFGVATSEVA